MATRYRIIDDYGTNAGPTGGTVGGTSGQVLYDFTAPSTSAAAQFAHVFSSMAQRPVRWGAVDGPFGMTIMIGVPATNALTNIPSGISY